MKTGAIGLTGSRWLRWIQWVVAVVCLVVGAAGLVLPLVPGILLIFIGVTLSPPTVRRPVYRWLRQVLQAVGVRRNRRREA